MQLYVTADQAASMLGVDVRTLYSYVSRKKLRTLRHPGERQSLYWRADVEAAAGIQSDRVSISPLVPATRITLITPDGPYYRGQSAIALAEHATLEEVAAVLWQVDDAFAGEPPRLPDVYRAVAAQVAGLSSGERATALLPLVEAANPRSFDFGEQGYARTGADVVRLYAAIAAGAVEPSTEPVHSFIGRSLGVEPVYYDLIRRMLVLGADHELDPTTYAVRALANTGVTPYAITIAGLMAFRGRRLRISRKEMAIRLVGEILGSPDPEQPLVQRFRDGEALPGFDRNVYPASDPRAGAIFDAFDRLIGDDAEYRRLKRAVAVGRELTGHEPDLHLASAFLRRKLGGADGMSMIAVGRIVGWVAHAMEQYADSDLVRPRASYVGILPDARGEAGSPPVRTAPAPRS